MATLTGNQPKKRGHADGLVYYEMNGKQIVRSSRRHGPVKGNTRRHAILMSLISKHAKLHASLINQSFPHEGSRYPRTFYIKANYAWLREALMPLVEHIFQREQKVNSRASKEDRERFYARRDAIPEVKEADVEKAIADFAAAHPNTLVMAQLPGYETLYLDGPWPQYYSINPTEPGLPAIIVGARVEQQQ
ncbi:MAG: hypothetical protein MJZ81_04475 [Bacteroidales bacterium]|nr:hypothetical protein [Bacteroidales bacterium]